MSPRPSLWGAVKLTDEGAAEGSEDKGCRTPGSVSLPGVGERKPAVAVTQLGGQIGRKSVQLPSQPSGRQARLRFPPVTASCRGPRLKTVTAGPGAAQECGIPPAGRGEEEASGR